MKQSDIADAVAVYLEAGDLQPWRAILDAVRDGHIEVEEMRSSTNFVFVRYPAMRAFGGRLHALQQDSGMTQKQIAEQMNMSLSAVVRQLQGQVLPGWPAVAGLIAHMGADPWQYRDEYDLARIERYGK